MRTIIIRVATAVFAFGALLGIKMMDLPGLITALLVIVVIGFVMFGLIFDPDRKKTSAAK
jgi:hypothetical protein